MEEPTENVDSSEEVQDLEDSIENLGISDTNYNAQVHILFVPFNPDYVIAKERLTIDKSKVLHSGDFSLTHQGTLTLEKDTTTAPVRVAVKSIKSDADVHYFKAMLCEIKLLTYLGFHGNILSLIGAVTENVHKGEVHLVTEFCAKGNLLDYLHSSIRFFHDLWASDSIAHEQNSEEDYENLPRITTLELLRWSIQILNGMIFLAEKNIVHGDLAVRNVVLRGDNVAQITNFGISSQLIQFSNDLNPSSANKILLPWRSMAIECFTALTFSLESDIWSFGVTLWELFTLGNVPFTWKHCLGDFVRELVSGLRPDPPTFGNEKIYQLMLDCMQLDPKKRSPFSELRVQLETMESSLTSCE